MELTESLKALEEKIDLAASKSAEASKAQADEVKALSDKCASMATDIQALQQAAVAAPVVEEKHMTLADKIAESADYKAFVEGRSRSVRMNFAAVATPEGAVAPEMAGIAGEQDLLSVESLFSAAATSSNLIEFVRESAFTNAAAPVAEGAAKPESGFTFKTVQAPVQTIAHWIKITKQLASDSAALASYIQGRMANGLAAKVEAQLVAGDGKTPNLSGIFTDGNYTAHGQTASTASSVIDLIALSIAKVQEAGYNPSAVLMNPADWAALSLEKDAQKRYLIGDPASATAPRIWGVPVVVSAQVAKGKFMVGDFKSAGTVFTRQGVTVEAFEQDADNVEKNLVTVRAECRKALAIEHPLALVGGSLTLS